ncbi:hypothetical protein BTHERMOSOX_1885 [Bathymodiolus thermophilus thioautotrophic gill symbiont]|nr:hypothetical protein BTHERMOSOX_1885 [Bathymodiolus thermophilus thioautotrophic gill symbiont]
MVVDIFYFEALWTGLDAEARILVVLVANIETLVVGARGGFADSA